MQTLSELGCLENEPKTVDFLPICEQKGGSGCSFVGSKTTSGDIKEHIAGSACLNNSTPQAQASQ
jgi:hypothetical protein